MSENRNIEFSGFGAQFAVFLALILSFVMVFGIIAIAVQLDRIAIVAERAYPVPQEKTFIKKGGEEVCGWAVEK